jgi:hypothetical protein
MYSATTSLHLKDTGKSLEEANEHGPRKKYYDDWTKKEHPVNHISFTLTHEHTAVYLTADSVLVSTE